MKRISGCLLLVLSLVTPALAQPAPPSPPPCGPVVAVPLGATAIAMWGAPVFNALGAPLTNPITQYNIYLDPAGCAVDVGITVPTAVVAAPTTSWPVPAGNHALFVTAVNVDGESAPAGPILFSRQP